MKQKLGIRGADVVTFGSNGSWKIHGHEYPLNVFDASL